MAGTLGTVTLAPKKVIRMYWLLWRLNICPIKVTTNWGAMVPVFDKGSYCDGFTYGTCALCNFYSTGISFVFIATRLCVGMSSYDPRQQYSIHSFIMLSAIFSMYIAICLDAVVNWRDLKQSMATVRAIVGVADFLCGLIYIGVFRNSFDRLILHTEDFVWEDLPLRDSETEDFNMVGWIERSQKLAVKVYFICIGFHITQSTVRMSNDRVMVFNSWYPFDIFTSPAYEIIAFTQFLGAHIAVCIFVASITLYAVLTSIACSQLDKVKLSLQRIKQNHDMQEQLKECVHHHQQVLAFMDSMEETLTVFLFINMLVLFLGTCFIAFSAVTSWGDHADVSQAFIGYVMFTGHTFVLCWFGSKLTKAAEDLRDVAYESDWVGAPIPFQKSIMLIISRGNKEFALTAGKLVPLSNATLLNMMNQCLSFFMFLLHVKDRNEEVAHLES